MALFKASIGLSISKCGGLKCLPLFVDVGPFDWGLNCLPSFVGIGLCDWVLFTFFFSHQTINPQSFPKLWLGKRLLVMIGLVGGAIALLFIKS